jgi:tetratricopeptide (TPR) repeat protein
MEAASGLTSLVALGKVATVFALRSLEDRTPLYIAVERRYRCALLLGEWDHALSDCLRLMAMKDARGTLPAKLYHEKAWIMLQKAKPREGRGGNEEKNGMIPAANVSEFLKVCAEMAESFRESMDPQAATLLARTRLIVPDGLTAHERIQLLREAKRAYDADPENGGCCEVYGAAMYRVGEFQNAVDLLRKAVLKSDGLSNNWQQCFLAMAYHRQGSEKQAHDWLARAVRSMEKEVNPNWELQVQWHYLRREAEATLGWRVPPEGPQAPADPATPR